MFYPYNADMAFVCKFKMRVPPLRPLFLFSLLWFVVSVAPASARTAEEELIYRASFGRVADVQILLSQGANPNATDASGASALAVASDRNEAESVAIAEVLMKAGANPNVPDGQNNYPLHNAIRQKNHALVALLLQNGAKYDVKDNNGTTPLGLATQLNDDTSKAAIQQAIDRDRAAFAMQRSKENLEKLTRTLSYQTCAEAYFTIVLGDNASGAAETKAAYEARVNYHKQAAQAASRDLRRVFGIKDKEVAEVIGNSRKTINDELGWLGEKRKRAPFGTDDDMNNRCAAVSAKWQIKWDPQQKPKGK